MSSLFRGFAVALLCMYVLLAVEFKSYMQPLLVMLIIPFGMIGAVIGPRGDGDAADAVQHVRHRGFDRNRR